MNEFNFSRKKIIFQDNLMNKRMDIDYERKYLFTTNI